MREKFKFIISVNLNNSEHLSEKGYCTFVHSTIKCKI